MSFNNTKKLVEGHTQEKLLGVAKSVVEEKTNKSLVLDRDVEARIPKFSESGKLRFDFCPHKKDALTLSLVAYVVSYVRILPSYSQNYASDACWDEVAFAS
jgi:hypothetical protein